MGMSADEDGCLLCGEVFIQQRRICCGLDDICERERRAVEEENDLAVGEHQFVLFLELCDQVKVSLGQSVLAPMQVRDQNICDLEFLGLFRGENRRVMISSDIGAIQFPQRI